MKIAYADPPYPGMSDFYVDHPDYGGEVDHGQLIDRMCAEYDGWVLHTAAKSLRLVLPLCPEDARVGAWVKPFAAFKRNVMVAWAWEPVIFWGGRPRPKDQATVRDWIAEPMTLKRGLVGAKPDAVCRWAFEILGCTPEDELDDLFPGSGAVTAAWNAWRDAPPLTRLDFCGGGAKAESTMKLGEEVA